MPETVDLTLGDADDLIVVAHTRRAPPSAPRADQELCIVSCNIDEISVKRKRLRAEVEEVQAVEKCNAGQDQKRHRFDIEQVSVCQHCEHAETEFNFARCSHMLCSSCVAESITSSDGSSMRETPICPMPNCRAPLSANEASDVLLRADIDVFALDSLQTFYEKFAKGDGASDTPTLLIENGRAVLDELSEDESWIIKSPKYSFASLYTQGPSGKATCKVCRGHATNQSKPHCSDARSLGFLTIISRLRSVFENNSLNVKEVLSPNLVMELELNSGNSTANASDTVERKRKNCSRGKLKATTKGAKRSRSTPSAKGFIKGTGYGGSKGTEWIGLSHEKKAELEDKDAEVAFYLGILLPYLSYTRDDLPSWPSYFRLLIRESGYLGVLGNLLRSASMMEVGSRPNVYIAAVLNVRALVLSEALRCVATTPLWDDGGTMISSLEILEMESTVLAGGAGQQVLPKSTKSFCGYLRRAQRCIKKSLDELSRANDLNKRVVPENIPAQEAKKKIYEDSIKQQQFEPCHGLASSFSFRAEAQATTAHISTSDAGPRSRQRLLRLSREMASLATSLPLSYESSVAIRVDEDRYDCLQALIFGPEDTPYSNGVFLFDIFLPANYPNQPPKVKFLTTGGGHCRFNPNLYADGKVCLSLLGTWQGPSWTSASTLLQVLVSIQSLILVADPYFNEPGYEGRMGTPQGKKESELYNKTIRSYTLEHALISVTKNLPAYFHDLVHRHLTLKKDSISANAVRWQKSANSLPFPLPNFPHSLGAILPRNSCGPDTVSSEQVARLQIALNQLDS